MRHFLCPCERDSDRQNARKILAALIGRQTPADSNDWASVLLFCFGLAEPFARVQGRLLRIMLGRLIVKNHVEKGLIDMDAAVVIDKAELAKPIHEEANPGSSRSDHVGKGLLRDLGNFHQRFA